MTEPMTSLMTGLMTDPVFKDQDHTNDHDQNCDVRSFQHSCDVSAVALWRVKKKKVSSILEIIGGVGNGNLTVVGYAPGQHAFTGVPHCHRGTTLLQGYHIATGVEGTSATLSQDSHRPHEQTSIWQEMVHMARFGSIFLAGKICNNNIIMVTLLT